MMSALPLWHYSSTVKISLISIFSFFLVFNDDFVVYIDITNVAALNTAIDDVTN